MLNFISNFAGFGPCGLVNSELNIGIMVFGLLVNIIVLFVIFSGNSSDKKLTDEEKFKRVVWRREKGAIVGALIALYGIAQTYNGGINNCEENITYIPFVGFLLFYVGLFIWTKIVEQSKK